MADLIENTKPRGYKPDANILAHTYKVMFRDHPESFDCVVYPADGNEQNEIIAQEEPQIALLDREERAQSYGEPVAARARIIPDGEPFFDVTDSAMYEAFHSAPEVINIMVSVPGLRTFSIIRWREYESMDSEDTFIRSVYVQESRPLGRTLNVGVVCACRPLWAEGEIPSVEDDNGNDTGNNGNEIGVL